MAAKVNKIRGLLLTGVMEYIKFGNTGLMVSRLCLGCMTYGKPTERWQWALDETQSRPFFEKAPARMTKDFPANIS